MHVAMNASMKESIAGRLRARRVELDWTQQELAAKAKMRQSSISEIESGKYAPTIDTLFRLAAAMKCKVADLLQ